MSVIWFDRKFDFTMPVEMFPMIVERLRGTPARLEEMTRTIDPGMLSRRQGEAWSILESIGHLGDLEPLWDGRLDDFLADDSNLRPAELTNRVTHEANHNEANLDMLLKRFRVARMKMVDRLDGMSIDDASRTALHPRLSQPMRMIDSAFFNAEHDDHHLARITELVRLIVSG